MLASYLSAVFSAQTDGIQKKEAFNNLHELLLSSLGEYVPSCDTEAFRNVTSEYVDLRDACGVSLNSNEYGGLCSPACRDFVSYEQEVFGSACTYEKLVAQALFLTNVTANLFDTWAFPEGQELELLNAWIKPAIESLNLSADYISELSNNETSRSDLTMIRPLFSVASDLQFTTVWMLLQGCLDVGDLFIEDFSPDMTLDVTQNRTDEEKKEISRYRDSLAQARTWLVQLYGDNLPEQCRGEDFIRPSDDYLELMMKCNAANSVINYFNSSQVAGSCPEVCVQFSTLSEMELPACQLAEDLIQTSAGYDWALDFAYFGELPAGDDQKFFASLFSAYGNVTLSDDLFDQDDIREMYKEDAIQSAGFLRLITRLPSGVSLKAHLGCYRNNPNMPYLPLAVDGTPVLPPSTPEGEKEASPEPSASASGAWHASPATATAITIVGVLVLSFFA